MKEKLVIIGGVAAGMSAAAKANRVNSDLDIHVYTDDEYISYAGCGLPYFIGDRIDSERKLLARSVEQFAHQNIHVHTRHRVERIVPDQGRLQVQNLIGPSQREVPFDRLIVSTGARPSLPAVDGLHLPGVFTLRTIQDSLTIRQYFMQEQPREAVIIGGGYIGLEMVENLLEYDCRVTVIEQAGQIVPNMDPDMAAILRQYLESRGVVLVTGEHITGLSGDRRVREVITNQGTYPADFVLLAVGVRPNSELAEPAGIQLGTGGAIRVNSRMETSIPGIYACGDCATAYHLVSRQEVFIPMGTTANKQGKVAGENAAGGRAAFKGVLGTGIAQVMDMEISRTGLTEKECQQLGIDCLSRTIKAKTAAGYWPTAADIHLKVVVDKTQRVVGAQIVGFAGAAKRIDILATAITLGATVGDLVDMDLAYSPPFSPVWDPVLIALNQF